MAENEHGGGDRHQPPPGHSACRSDSVSSAITTSRAGTTVHARQVA